LARQSTPRPNHAQDDPAALRLVFGDNLRALSAGYPSITAVCRDLGINRTQFNRYMSGESFPRPDVLHRICTFFGVDARILLEPVTEIRAAAGGVLAHPFLEGFFSHPTVDVPPDLFPSGFYSFARKSFLDEEKFVSGLVLVTRRDAYTFLRGFEPRSALREKGLSTAPYTSEYRGLIMRQEEGIVALVAHRDAMSCSFNFLTPETAFQSTLWEGYATRSVREKVTGRRATRLVYEHLGNNPGRVLAAARKTGVVPRSALPPIYVHLLRSDDPFH